MINFKIKNYSDNGEEIFFNIEIITNSFNNLIIPIEETYKEAFEVYVLLKSNNSEYIDEYLEQLIESDDIECLSQLSQQGAI